MAYYLISRLLSSSSPYFRIRPAAVYSIHQAVSDVGPSTTLRFTCAFYYSLLVRELHKKSPRRPVHHRYSTTFRCPTSYHRRCPPHLHHGFTRFVFLPRILRQLRTVPPIRQPFYCRFACSYSTPGAQQGGQVLLLHPTSSVAHPFHPRHSC